MIDTSGHYHVETDIFDVHDYEQDVTEFAGHYEAMKEGGAAFVTFPDRQQYQGCLLYTSAIYRKTDPAILPFPGNGYLSRRKTMAGLHIVQPFDKLRPDHHMGAVRHLDTSRISDVYKRQQG